jgi:hypothetical protein
LKLNRNLEIGGGGRGIYSISLNRKRDRKKRIEMDRETKRDSVPMTVIETDTAEKSKYFGKYYLPTGSRQSSLVQSNYLYSNLISL